MCFAFDARPPELPAEVARAPIAGGAGAELLELTAADGATFSAAMAEASDGRDVGVVILPDVRGLYRFYAELAERFAQAGYSAIALDYFGRSAGLGPRGEDFDYMTHIAQLKPEHVQLDTAAALAALRERTAVSAAVSVGFCFGGTMSFLAGTNAELDLDGVVGFYAALDASRFGIAGPLERAAEIRCPVLGLFGGADQVITEEQVRSFDERLSAAGIEREIKIYPGAPHSFFDRSFEEHAEASADAWRRVLGFLERIGARTAA
jgi:carboxymethylenebutenolidase